MPPRTTLSEVAKEKIYQKSHYRCGYCQSSAKYIYAKLRIDHLLPLAAGGTDDDHNLWATCDPCNGHKADKVWVTDPETKEKVRLFNPQTQHWIEHFTWGDDKATIIGLTSIGRATVEALLMNDPDFLAIRRRWVSVGWYPPTDLT